MCWQAIPIILSAIGTGVAMSQGERGLAQGQEAAEQGLRLQREAQYGALDLLRRQNQPAERAATRQYTSAATMLNPPATTTPATVVTSGGGSGGAGENDLPYLPAFGSQQRNVRFWV